MLEYRAPPSPSNTYENDIFDIITFPSITTGGANSSKALEVCVRLPGSRCGETYICTVI